MDRDRLKKEINDALDREFPENVDLDGDDFDQVETVVSNVCEEAVSAMDSAEDEDVGDVEA